MVTSLRVYRPAFKDEEPRARHVFPGAPRGSAAPLIWFLAVKASPVERIVGAIWARVLPRVGCVEFDWCATAALPEAELPAFFAAWRAWLAARPGLPVRLRLHGWRAPAVNLGNLSRLLGAEGEIETKEPLTAPLTALEPRLADAVSTGLSPVRALGAADLPALGRFVEARALLEPHEWIDAVKAASTAAPTLFDPRFSTARFADGELAGLCLATYAGSHARILALVAAESASPASVAMCIELLRDSLARLRRHVPVEHVLFDCAPEPPLREALGLASAGVSHRLTFPLLAP